MTRFLGRDETGDLWLDHAVREIYSTYGDIVSPTRKSKSLNKFGITRNLDSNVLTTIADFQGTEVNETFETTNAIDSVISTSGSDTGVMTIEGHTIDASGNLTFTVQNVTLTGQTRAALTTPLARATRAYVKDGTFASPSSNLAGIVSVYDDAGGDNGLGVPNTATAVKLRVRGDLGINQSEKCATSVSQYDYWIVHAVHCALRRTTGTAVSADFDIQVKHLGGVWLPAGIEANLRSDSTNFAEIGVSPYLIVPPNSDVRLVATGTGTDAVAAGRIEGILALKFDNDYSDPS